MREIKSIAWTVNVIEAIPHEIWQEIFEIYCASIDLQCITRWDDKGPWILVRVCREWRIVALSTPVLWSNIDIQCYCPRRVKWGSWGRYEIVEDSPGYHKAVEDRLRCQLLRSKNAPLVVYCYGLGGGTHQKPEIEWNITALYRILLKYCDRWRNAYLWNVHPSFHDLFEEERAHWIIERQKIPFPALRELSIARAPPGLYDVFKYPLPNLMTISLPALEYDAQVLALPLPHITHCVIAEAYASIAIPLLLQFKNTLEELSLTESLLSRTKWVLPHKSGSYMEFPRLRRLTVSNPTVQHYCVFNCITLPLLEYLEIHSKSTEIGIPYLSDMFQRSQHPHLLRRLKIADLHFSQIEGLRPLLRLLTGLEELCLYVTWSLDPGGMEAGFDVLMSILDPYDINSNHRSQVFSCPRLRKLVVGRTSHQTIPSGFTRIDLSRLADMIELRWGACLQDACISLDIQTDMELDDRPSTVEACSRLRNLKAKGLDLSIKLASTGVENWEESYSETFGLVQAYAVIFWALHLGFMEIMDYRRVA